MSNIGDTIQDGSVVWTVGRKVTNAPNIIADCDSVMEGSIKQFDSTTSNIPAVGTGGNLVTVGLASSKAQIAVTSDNKVYYRSYASSAWGTWQRLTTASEIVDSMSIGQTGYVKFGSLLNGLLIEWGLSGDFSGATKAVTFPVTFPHGCAVLVTSPANVSITGAVGGIVNSTSQATLTRTVTSSTNGSSIYWLGIGN